MSSLKDTLYESLPYYLQSIVLSVYGKKLKEERFCDRYFKYQEFLNKSQCYSIGELEEYQNEKLKELIDHVYEFVPYYRRIFTDGKFTPGDIKKKEDLQIIPVLTKDDIRNNYNNLISKNHQRNHLKKGHSSGTTGSPLEILWDRNVNVAHNVFIWRHRKWAGFEFGERYATLLGRVVVPLKQKCPPFHRINKPWNQYFFSSFHLKDENLKYYFDEFERSKIQFMEAYPSTVFVLAKYLEQHNLYYELKAIVTTSETLLPFQREIIEERFKCKIFDYYGMAERVMFSGECEDHKGHHLHMEYGVTEILDTNNEAVPGGCHGKLVLTGLHNYGMPLIRYEIGDVSMFKSEKCSCGRNLPLLGDVTTKAEDIIVTKDGRLISPSILTHPFKPMHNIEKSQIIQEDYDRLLIKIVKRTNYSDSDTKKLLDAIQLRVGAEMNTSIEFVSDIPRSANGKYRWVISKVQIKFANNRIDNIYKE